MHMSGVFASGGLLLALVVCFAASEEVHSGSGVIGALRTGAFPPAIFVAERARTAPEERLPCQSIYKMSAGFLSKLTGAHDRNGACLSVRKWARSGQKCLRYKN